VQLGVELERIDAARRRLTFAGGETVDYERAIYTLPLNALPKLVSNLPPRVQAACSGLRNQGILCISLGIDRPHLSDYHWIYYYEDGFPFHRLSFPGNFSPANVPPGKSSISLEVAFPAGGTVDEEGLLEQTVAGLKLAHILGDEDRIDLVHMQAIEPAYVIYDLAHARNVEVIRSWLEAHGILLAGRFGQWQYANMDHAMRSGADAAHAILAERVA
jgi:protoporphyrinogen oxidase